MTYRSSLLLPLLLTSYAALCQGPAITIPAGTPLPVQIENHLPMRLGQPIRAQLIYPVYAGNTLVLPAKAIVTGSVVELHSNHARRVTARLRGDFTPFRTPIVRFDGILLNDGSTLPIATGTATDGAPIYRLVAPPPRKGGFIRQEWDTGLQILRDKLAIITGPDKRDRATQFLYTQLPYHPQRIEKNTAWTVETSEPLTLPPQAAEIAAAPAAAPATTPPAPPAAPHNDTAGTWIIQAYLGDKLSSATSKSGQEIHATVAEPIYNPDHTIAVPVGATMVGAVTQSKPARLFGRAGTLHFDFRQLVLPTGTTQNVQASLTEVDSDAGQKLALDSEGQVKPKPQDKLLVPFALLVLAARPLDVDKGDGAGGGFGKDAVASNSIGVLGFIIGTAAGQRNIAAGLGYYGAAISIYERWIKRGKEVSFARHTRLVLQTTPRNAPALKPTR
jgi:hypothetical protein